MARGDTSDSTAKPRKLGRGLSSLLGSTVEVVPIAAPTGHTALPDGLATTDPRPDGGGQAPPGQMSVLYISVSTITANTMQPRRRFDEASLRELSESIKQSGVIQPIVVRPASRSSGAGGGSGAVYELVAGERRWRAAVLAGLAVIPAVVRTLSDEQSAEWALVENVQREDLNGMERAWAFRALADRFGLTHQQIAERVGLERSSVANFVRLTELEEAVQALIAENQIGAGHGKALLAMAPGPARVRLGERAAREGWAVRRLERAVALETAGSAEGATAPRAALGRSASIEDLERRLGVYLGSKVTIRTDRAGSRGRLIVEFYGLDHFDGMMNTIGFTSASRG